jgi:hypothetical protein
LGSVQWSNRLRRKYIMEEQKFRRSSILLLKLGLPPSTLNKVHPQACTAELDLTGRVIRVNFNATVKSSPLFSQADQTKTQTTMWANEYPLGCVASAAQRLYPYRFSVGGMPCAFRSAGCHTWPKIGKHCTRPLGM